MWLMWMEVWFQSLLQRHDLRERVQPALLFDGKTDAGPWKRQVKEKGLSGNVAATLLTTRSVIIHLFLSRRVPSVVSVSVLW